MLNFVCCSSLRPVCLAIVAMIRKTTVAMTRKTTVVMTRKITVVMAMTRKTIVVLMTRGMARQTGLSDEQQTKFSIKHVQTKSGKHISLTSLTSPHCCACPSPSPVFSAFYVVVCFMFNDSGSQILLVVRN
jgi:hypothetical protein